MDSNLLNKNMIEGQIKHIGGMKENIINALRIEILIFFITL